MASWRSAALAVVVGVVAALAAACGGSGSRSGNGAGATPTPGSLEARTCPTGSPLTYADFGEPFFADWCTGCHSSGLTTLAERQNAPLGVDYDTLAGIQQWKDSIYLYATDDHTLMPPGGVTLDTSLRFALGDWLACGAP